MKEILTSKRTSVVKEATLLRKLYLNEIDRDCSAEDELNYIDYLKQNQSNTIDFMLHKFSFWSCIGSEYIPTQILNHTEIDGSSIVGLKFNIKNLLKEKLTSSYFWENEFEGLDYYNFSITEINLRFRFTNFFKLNLKLEQSVKFFEEVSELWDTSDRFSIGHIIFWRLCAKMRSDNPEIPIYFNGNYIFTNVENRERLLELWHVDEENDVVIDEILFSPSNESIIDSEYFNFD